MKEHDADYSKELARQDDLGTGDDSISIHQRIPVQSIKVTVPNNTLEVKGAKGNIQISLIFQNKDVLSTLLDAVDVASASNVGLSSNSGDNTDVAATIYSATKPIKLEENSNAETDKAYQDHATEDNPTVTGKRKALSTSEIMQSQRKQTISMAPKSKHALPTMPHHVSLASSSTVGLPSKVPSTKSEKKVFRLVLFRGKQGNDVFGRGPGLFALKHGCVYESNLFLPPSKFPKASSHPMILSEHFFQNEHRYQQAKRSFAERFQKDIELGENRVVTKRIWNKQNLFATMPKGSIVCMILNNAPGFQDCCFGVVQSKNEFCIKGREGLKGVPVPINHGGLEDTFLYHPVKWVCHAKMRDLPGHEVNTQGGVFLPWMCTTSPYSIMEMKKANDYMHSEEFKKCISKDFTVLLEEADEMLEM
jgi:hypothetical protein